MSIGADLSTPFGWSSLSPAALSTFLDLAKGISASAVALCPDSRTSGIRALADEFSLTTTYSANVWSLELKTMLSCIAGKVTEPAVIVRAVGTYLLKNTKQDVELRLPHTTSPAPSIFRGRALRWASDIEVQRANGFVTMTQRDGPTRTFADTTDLLTVAVSRPASEVSLFDDPHSAVWESRDGFGSEPSPLPSTVEQAAIDTGYAAWVHNAIRLVLLIPNEGFRFESGSWDRLLGSIYATNGRSEQLLDALIHEASHQYFYLGKWLGDFSVSDAPQYFSPAVGRVRPLWAILLSYHAFANVAIYYSVSGLANAQEDVGWFQRNRELSRAFGEILQGNTYLTDQGVELFETLRRFERELVLKE